MDFKMDCKTDVTMRLMRRLCSGGVEAEDLRATRLEHLEEFVWRGDYRVPAGDIVDAMLATGPRFGPAPAESRRMARRGSRPTRFASQF